VARASTSARPTHLRVPRPSFGWVWDQRVPTNLPGAPLIPAVGMSGNRFSRTRSSARVCSVFQVPHIRKARMYRPPGRRGKSTSEWTICLSLWKLCPSILAPLPDGWPTIACPRQLWDSPERSVDRTCGVDFQLPHFPKPVKCGPPTSNDRHAPLPLAVLAFPRTPSPTVARPK
jgi:hypothetical protein